MRPSDDRRNDHVERSARTTGTAPSHLDDLRALVARPGPFATVALARPDPGAATVDATAKEVRHAMAATPLTEQADAVATTISGALAHAPGAVVVADGEGVLLVEHLDDAPRWSGVRVGALPVLAPIVERRAGDLPVVTVEVDRTGADVSWSTPLAAGATATGEVEVEGAGPHIRKVHGGGWSHRRFQQRAEEAWEHTARDVAQAVTERATEIGARLVVAGGDDRMVQLVRERVPDELAALVREVPGSRSADGSEEERDAAAERWRRTAVAEDTRAALLRFDQELGQREAAATGWADVLGALREGRVDVLLLHDGGEDEPTAGFVPDAPSLVARRAAELDQLGHAEVRTARAADVALRAALLTSADVRIVPTTPRLDEGVGALLRW